MSAFVSRVALQDANLLLLYLAGKTDPALLGRWKRVATFEYNDLGLLRTLLQQFRSQVTTPHILAEVSNFVDQAPPPSRAGLIESFREFAGHWPEIFEQAALLVRRPEFPLLALTDTGLIHLSRTATVLTIDFHLAARINAQGGSVINFNHLRYGAMLP